MKIIRLARPAISKKDIKAVDAVLKTPHLSLGPKQEEFQEKFRTYTGTKYAITVSNGTCGLHILMKAFGISRGDEVITTPYSFIASSNCILFVGAKPVFVDIEPGTFNIDSGKIEASITKKTKAILVVHVFGMPADMKAINKVAKKHGLVVIEDACEAIGAEINGKKAGTFSDAAVFAFYPNKQMTTGEGGMIVTNRKDVSGMCMSLKNQGRDAKGQFVNLGYNYRISDINCALGISQLSRINNILRERAKKAGLYGKYLRNINGIKPLSEKKGYKRSWFVYVVKLDDKCPIGMKYKLMASLRKKGIECGDYFPAIHLTPLYRRLFGYKRNDFPVTERVSDRTFALPFYNDLKTSDIRMVAKRLKEAMARAKRRS